MPDVSPDKGFQQSAQEDNGQADSESEQQKFLQMVYEKIAEAELQIAQGCCLEDAETLLAGLKRKYTQQKNVE